MSTTTNKQSNPSQFASDKLAQTANVATEKLQQAGQHFVVKPASDLFSLLKDYAHEKPDVAAMWCFGLGLVVGWKLRG